jgi:hypothetical protein
VDKLTRQLYIDKKTLVRIFKENWDWYKRLCGYRKVEDENVQHLFQQRPLYLSCLWEEMVTERIVGPGRETLFVCTNCGTPMKPKEKE